MTQEYHSGNSNLLLADPNVSGRLRGQIQNNSHSHVPGKRQKAKPIARKFLPRTPLLGGRKKASSGQEGNLHRDVTQSNFPFSRLKP